MPRTIPFSHPDVSNNPTSYLSGDVASGATVMNVKDTAGFVQSSFILVSKFGNSQSELAQITSIVSNTQFAVSALAFGHSTDSSITQIDYNQFKVYRSLSGVGGVYQLLATNNLIPDLIQNEYFDPAAQSPYSYRFSYWNSVSMVESDLSDEFPYAGFPFYTLKSIQDRTIQLFGDTSEQFITRAMITDWVNECNEDMQYLVTGGDSPYYVTNVVLPATGSLTYPIGSYAMSHIFLVELSYDGVNFNDTIGPVDARANTTPEASPYGWQLMGSTMIIKPQLFSGSIRIWYYTLPTLVANQSDTLLDPFRGHTRIFVNYCLMRAHEKDRKVTEMGAYYQKRYYQERDEVVMKLKSRIKQAGMSMLTTWEDDYASSGM